MESTITSQRALDHCIVRGQRSSFHSDAQNDTIQRKNNDDSILQNRTDMNELIELISEKEDSDDDDDDDDVIGVWDGESSFTVKTFKSSDILSCKPQDHIQLHGASIQETSAILFNKATTTTSTKKMTNITTKPITLKNQHNLDLDGIEFPNTIQTSVVLDDCNRSEPNCTPNMYTQKFHEQRPTMQQEQNQKENVVLQQTKNMGQQRSCRKRCSPQEAAELSDLRIRLELQSGYKPSIEEVAEKYQLKKMEENKKRKILQISSNKKGSSIYERKKRFIIDDNCNRQKSHTTRDECRNNDEILSLTIPSSTSTRCNISSPVKCVIALNTNKTKWENMYETLVEYIHNQKSSSNNKMTISKGEGSSTIIPSIWDGHVPCSFITNDGKRLGKWIVNQRTKKKQGTLNPEREQRLSSIGLKWRKNPIIPWDDMFESLQRYVTNKRKLNKDWSGGVPPDYRTVDNPPRLLGPWLRVQCCEFTKNKLCNEYVQKLNSLNFYWITKKILNSNAKKAAKKASDNNNNKNNDENYNINIIRDENTTSSKQQKQQHQQQQQQQQHGRRDSKLNYKTAKTKATKSNDNNDQMKATSKNNKASSSDKKHENTNISKGVKCCDLSNTQNSVWEHKYESLVEYVNQKRSKEGSNTLPWIWDGNVPHRFITNDGIHLGEWIVRQRSAKRNGALNHEREQRLISIGLNWEFYPKLIISSKQKQREKHGRNDKKCDLKTTKTTTKTNCNNQMQPSDNKHFSAKKYENVSKSKDKFENETCMIYQESISLENSTEIDTLDHYDIKDNDSSSRQVDSIIKNNETITLIQQQEEEVLKSQKLKLQKYPLSFFD